MVGNPQQNSLTVDGGQPRLALRPKEAALALGIGRRKLWELTNRGSVPHMRIGRSVLYPVASLEAWLIEESQAAKRGGVR